jgi:D-tagatose-1,6-bisphosphate aldolase subunit GatZ/KbaZ
VSTLLDAVVERQKSGEPAGVIAVCSAHPLVLKAALEELKDGAPVIVEATSNQVDQDGGYTGMRPLEFRLKVEELARECGVPPSAVVLGGDHLGPNRWRALPGNEAMAKADILVGEYVVGGYQKLHLDCSYACSDDPRPLPPSLAVERTLRLVRRAEALVGAEDEGKRPRYVIGTEVPAPGGVRGTLGGSKPTTSEEAAATLGEYRRAFVEEGLGAVWRRVRALVVQPGVEFGEFTVEDYRPEDTRELSRVLDEEPGVVFEAHSTDYQRRESLASLVRDHWAILKVGPALTFALREAVFGLVDIEEEIVAVGDQSELKSVLERRMLADRRWWEGYASGTETMQRVSRRYSYSDRVRYYWADGEVQRAVERLFENLSHVRLPLSLLRQYLPLQAERVRKGVLAWDATALVVDHVRDVLKDYVEACDRGGALPPAGQVSH